MTTTRAPDSVRALRGVKVWWFLGVVSLLAVCIASLTPLSYMPKAPGTDKTHHFLSYALLAFWWAQLVPQRLRVGFALIAMGAAIEVLQPIVASRNFEWLDMAANTVGVGLGLALARTRFGHTLQALDRLLFRGRI